MQRILLCSLFLTLAIANLFCGKEKKTGDDCPGSNAVIRQVLNHPAVVRDMNGRFYIIEQGTIDTRLLPCNLPDEYKVNNLSVSVSGEVRSSSNSTDPCCTENLFITKITR